MTTTLWIAQLSLGALFLLAGSFKALRYRQARAVLPWIASVPAGLVRLIGVSELLGGLGLLLPPLTHVATFLTPLAGAGLATVMSLAAAFHLRRHELGAIPVNVALGALAVFVACGRWPLLHG